MLTNNWLIYADAYPAIQRSEYSKHKREVNCLSMNFSL